MIRLPLDPLLRPLAAAASAVGLSRSSSDRPTDSVSVDASPTDEGEQAVAQKTTVQLVDDLDGSEAEATVSFGLDGTSYEIDLSAEHAAALRDALAPYVGAARRAGGAAGAGRRGGRRGSGSSSAPSGSDRQRTAAIRAWAREQGMEVSERGRIPNQIVHAYEAAH